MNEPARLKKRAQRKMQLRKEVQNKQLLEKEEEAVLPQSSNKLMHLYFPTMLLLLAFLVDRGSKSIPCFLKDELAAAAAASELHT